MKRLVFYFVLICSVSLGQSLPSIIETVSLTPAELDDTQARRYSALADSSDQYTEVHFVKVVLDTNSFDSLGRFFLSLPTIIERDLEFSLKSFELPNESEVHDSTSFYIFGQHFHYSEDESDTLFGYSSIGLYRHVKDEYWGHFRFEDEDYDIYDLSGGVQLLCKTDLNMLSANDCRLSTVDL